MTNSRNDIDLCARQIKDNLTIHTCNEYNHSLELIRDASIKGNKIPKVISKVYYNYPNYKHKRFRPILDQLKETKQRPQSY